MAKRNFNDDFWAGARVGIPAGVAIAIAYVVVMLLLAGPPPASAQVSPFAPTRWEPVDAEPYEGTWRFPVPGGWIYHVRGGGVMAFVPDEDVADWPGRRGRDDGEGR